MLDDLRDWRCQVRRLHPSDYFGPTSLEVGHCRVAVVAEHLTLLQQDRIIDVNRAVSGPDQALEHRWLALLRLFLLIFVTSLPRGRNLILDGLIHRYWVDHQLALLMDKAVRFLLQEIFDQDVAARSHEGEQTRVYLLLGRAFLLSLPSPLASLVSLLVVHTLAVEHRNLGLGSQIFLLVSHYFLHRLRDHAVCDGHGVLGLL